MSEILLDQFINVRPTTINGGKKAFILKVKSKLPVFNYMRVREDLDVKMELFFLHTAVGDMDNFLKPIFDAMKKQIFYDDSQIKKLQVEMKEKSGKTGIYIKIMKLPLL